jgi:N6-L-threonylcarbamoyladenine synthase
MELRTDFSFSGLKTAVLREVRRLVPEGEDARAVLGEQRIADLCASFQRVVVEALLDRTFDAAAWLGARSIGIAGGVSANSRLRADAAARGERAGLPVYLPSLQLSTDNAAMIAAAGLRLLETGGQWTLDFNAEAEMKL